MAKRAVLIGINKYRTPGADLRGCVNDVKNLKKVLTEYYGFAGKDITVLTDLKWREILIMVPIVVLFVVIGLFPNLFFDKITPSVDALTRQINNPPTALMVEK